MATAFYTCDFLKKTDILVYPLDFVIFAKNPNEDGDCEEINLIYDPTDVAKLFELFMGGDGASNHDIPNGFMERRIESGLVRKIEVDNEDIERFREAVLEGDSDRIEKITEFIYHEYMTRLRGEIYEEREIIGEARETEIMDEEEEEEDEGIDGEIENYGIEFNTNSDGDTWFKNLGDEDGD
jgi:hypothetical protein